VHLWVLENGMAELTEAHDYMDMRQFLNISTDTSGGGGSTDENALFLAWRGYR
jgi:hypothetical protein